MDADCLLGKQLSNVGGVAGDTDTAFPAHKQAYNATASLYGDISTHHHSHSAARNRASGTYHHAHAYPHANAYGNGNLHTHRDVDS